MTKPPDGFDRAWVRGPLPSPPRELIGETRRWVLADGRPCTLVERPAPSAPWAKGATFLQFDCDQIARRIWRFPANWRELSDRELDALVEQL